MVRTIISLLSLAVALGYPLRAKAQSESGSPSFTTLSVHPRR